MQLANTLAILIGALSILSALPSMAVGQQPVESSGTVILRKPIGKAQILCTVGPSRDPAVLQDLVGKEGIASSAAIYEFHIDLCGPDAAPVRLWSALFSVGRQRLANARIQEIKPSSPEAKEHVDALDLLVVPPRKPSSTQLIMALRNPGGGFGLCRITPGGEGARMWEPPHINDWTGLDTPTSGDPVSASLSISQAGLCQVEITSVRRHTIYRQLAGKWEFEVEKQWMEGDEAKKK